MQEIRSDILIIGAGLTGLALAHHLQKHKVKVTIIEARSRLGGRIFTKQNLNYPPIELGATWISSQHTLLLKLLDELGIKTFEQEMGETAIYEAISTSPFQVVSLPKSELPSYRVQHGTHQIIEKLQSKIDKGNIYANQNIEAIQLQDNVISAKSATHSFNASIAISTLPPLLLINNISITPSQPNEVIQTARKTHTWMGDAIKISLTYEKKFWQEGNLSGTIFSNVGPINEMYDHSNFEDNRFALKGFLNGAYFGISKKDRLAIVLHQLEKYYGTQVNDFINYEEMVWKNEMYTSAVSSESILPHQNNGHPIYQRGYLDNRLFLGGTETSSESSGYMEGAIKSARQIYSKLKLNSLINEKLL